MAKANIHALLGYVANNTSNIMVNIIYISESRNNIIVDDKKRIITSSSVQRNIAGSYTYIGVPAAVTDLSPTVIGDGFVVLNWTAPNDGKTWKVVSISYRFTVQATGAATFGLEHAATAIAPGSGTLQTGALSLQGTANTTINGTLTTQTTVSPGQSLNLVVTNTAATTGLVGMVITVALQRIT